jgi:hypothetical protein
MNAALRSWADRLLGRGDAAITVPVMDGALKPNKALDEAGVVADLPDIDDVASDGTTLWVTAREVLYELKASQLVESRRFAAPISAFAARSPAEFAVALGGTTIQMVGGPNDGEHLTEADGKPLCSVNALAFDATGNLYFTEGSARWPVEKWAHDLMSLGKTGRVCLWPVERGPAHAIVRGLGFAFGCLPQGPEVIFSESWRHRVMRAGHGACSEVLPELPGYPSRLCPASDGGFWLTCFVCRTQLVEFVLREPAYRKRMMEEVDPRYWVAPALSSGRSFLEPLQGAGVKQMGVLKPWAPPHSYGLVIRVSGAGEILFSLHSRVDGHHHGITAVAEFEGALYVVSRGAGKLLRLPLSAPDGGPAS